MSVFVESKTAAKPGSYVDICRKLVDIYAPFFEGYVFIPSK